MSTTTPPEPESSHQASDGLRNGSGTQLHAGYSLETGVLARARNWVDVFGWIRLGRVLRTAGSPLLFLLVSLTLVVWLIGLAVLGGNASAGQHASITARALETNPKQWPGTGAFVWVDVLRSLTLSEALTSESFWWASSQNLWSRLFASIWTVLVWAPAAMVLLRQGALATAGRPLQPLGDVLRWVGRRIGLAYFSAIIPVVAVLSLLWIVPVIGWVARIAPPLLHLPFAVVIAVVALPIGMLALGSWVAVPISWAAIINEREPDPLDALSRGYEYLFRRPLRLVGYLAVASLILIVIHLLASLMMIQSIALVTGPLDSLSENRDLARKTAGVLRWFPVVVVNVVSWSLVGGVYLLLRQDAGGQEVEDLWIAPATPAEPLPELKA